MPLCPHCGQEIPVGQMELTESEVKALPTGNQNSDDLSVIEWQHIKALADFYNVRDWTNKVDCSLSYEENAELMREHGTNSRGPGGRTVRELAAEERAHQRWEQKR